MRLSSLVIAAVLSCSLPLFVFAQRSSGGGSFGGGHSGGGASSGGGSSSASRGGSIGGSSSNSRGSGGVSTSSGRSGSGGTGSSHISTAPSFSFSPRSSSEGSFRGAKQTGLNIRPNLLKSPGNEKIEEKPEKKGIFSFLHHKKPLPERTSFIGPRPRCRVGQKCFTQPTRCQTTLAWNNSYCGGFYDQYAWFNACQSLADQMARQREQMGTTSDVGPSLRYQMLENQYRQCMMRNGSTPFSSYLFMSDLEYP